MCVYIYIYIMPTHYVHYTVGLPCGAVNHRRHRHRKNRRSSRSIGQIIYITCMYVYVYIYIYILHVLLYYCIIIVTIMK